MSVVFKLNFDFIDFKNQENCLSSCIEWKGESSLSEVVMKVRKELLMFSSST